jgi:hypothetical protein
MQSTGNSPNVFKGDFLEPIACSPTKKEVIRASLLKSKLNVERYVEDPYEVDQHGD